MIVFDFLILISSTRVSFAFIDFSNTGKSLKDFYWLYLITGLFAVSYYFLTGLYKSLTRYTSSRLLYELIAKNGIIILLAILISDLFKLPPLALKYWFFLWLLLSISITVFRVILRDILLILKQKAIKKKKVAIYGAGYAGAELLSSLKFSNKYKVKIFIDDSPSLLERKIQFIPIKSFEYFIQNYKDIDLVLIAVPSIKKNKLKKIVCAVQDLGLKVLQIPSIDDLTRNELTFEKLKPILIEDLLGRDTVEPDPTLLGPCVINKSVCVTGAGGSIGAELCNKLIKLKPLRLILIDFSEASLYQLENNLKEINDDDIEIEICLGDCSNYNFLFENFILNKIDIIFHAAAYKHVPLVEKNPLMGISNNVFSALTVCKVANNIGLEKVILISSDKAVRPTSIMGASKRLSELIFQAFANDVIDKSDRTVFSIVRFGNVLGSSGSVVPLFRNQIDNGGPITITHPNIIRFFMTISEAAELVIQSASLSQGGEVFLLDMGEPVKIIDLAKQMINLSGLSLKDENNPEGEIEIEVMGLRPGEKLYEELLIDNKAIPTEHSLIFRAEESFLKLAELNKVLSELKSNIDKNDINMSFKLLKELVPEWKPYKQIK